MNRGAHLHSILNTFLLLLSVASCSIKGPVLEILSKVPIDMSDDQVVIGWEYINLLMLNSHEEFFVE